MRSVMFKSGTPFYAGILVCLILGLTGCEKPTQTKALFRLLHSDETGIHFSNIIHESDSFNIFVYDYIYNGAGVAIADFNNDGKQDVFFTGNMELNRLYLNKGDLKFEDVTDQANINQGRWNSGAVVVDINNDGWQDIYVCATKSEDSTKRANMLFLNKGLNENKVPVFEDVAVKYGVADTGHSHMATFFDYDLDGDLDLYVLTNKQMPTMSSAFRPKVVDGSAVTNDRLYRNNGDETFTNVTIEAGIVYEGFGLGLAISDFNLDGWPDIYVSNDFITNDLLYINNGNGTFSNQSPQWIGHQSQSSMGSDAADFNNDGLTDIVTMDMLPETNDRKKTSINNKSYLTYVNTESFGYEYQYMRNMLHLNNGLDKGVGFSEIGQMAGVFQTEWSWSALFADFDNDGLKDLMITNGFPKDITDKDFVAYREDVGSYVSYMTLLDSVPVVRIPNYAYKNNGDLTFKDVTKEWGLSHPSFSNGAAYVDLDNDGDLDYIVNNINEEAFMYENTLYTKEKKSDQHYLRVKLAGSDQNRQAIGSKLTFYYDQGKKQYFEIALARGYLSSVENTIHAGLGRASLIDSLIITWPDGKAQKLVNVKADQVLTVDYKPTEPKMGKIRNATGIFQDRTASLNLIFKHAETDKIDFNIQRTLPHKFSQSGPGLSVGDINGDNLEDLVIGGSSEYPTTFFLQQADGTFSKPAIIPGTEKKMYEDEGMLLFDADNDGDQDLYVVTGSMEFQPPSKNYRDKFYRNVGKGKFTLDSLAIPRIESSGSCVRAVDFDGDNDLDLFVAGRIVPGSYPLPAESYLLRNDNGKFSDVTSEVCPELIKVGMISDALFTDFDNDGKPDLILVGEFMPITCFKNSKGKYVRVAETGLENFTGWWNSISGGDFDNDGDIDYVAGNLGENNAFQVDSTYPLEVCAKDFDGNGSIDAILACYVKESLSNSEEKKLYPVHFWDEINSQSPRFRQQFSKYKHYSKVTLEQLFTEADLKDALRLKANYFESSFIENLGNGKFDVTPLPRFAQIAPVNGLVTSDVNSDGNLDIVLVGNDFGNEVFAGRYDALPGLVLLGDGKRNFTVLNSATSQFYVPKDAKALVRLSTAKGELYVASRNKESLKVFGIPSEKRGVFTPEINDLFADFVFEDGTKQRIEFYYGSGYLSQSSRTIRIPPGVKEMTIVNSKGESRKVSIKKV